MCSDIKSGLGKIFFEYIGLKAFSTKESRVFQIFMTTPTMMMIYPESAQFNPWVSIYCFNITVAGKSKD